MTDQFVSGSDNQTGDQPNTGSSFVDQTTGNEGEGQVDTKSVEHQLNVMQQRLTDKDEFINTLKDENQKTREMYAQLEERLQNMESISEVLKNKEQGVSTQETKLDEDELVGKVIENLNKKQTEEVYEQNFNTVRDRLVNEFGEQYVEDKVVQAANENGMSYEDMVATAKKSPKAFYKLVGLGDKKVSTPTPTHSSVSTSDFNTGEKDFAYYSRLMRENPREYWKQETQREFRKLFQDNN